MKSSTLYLHSIILILGLLLINCSADFKVGDRVIARWTNNLYYAGKIESITGRCRAYKVLFDDGDEMTYHPQDVSGMILNEVPSNIVFGQHVIATWKGGHKYFIGFVSEIDQQHRFKVRFDDNDEDWYEEHKLRLFPEAASPHEVGARVFARWTNGLYYRGFVTKSNRTTVFINYDDGDTITLKKLDRKAVVLDKLPKQWQLQLGKQVIGYWPGRVRYYPGVIASKSGCLHYVRFNDGDRRWAHLYEIRIIPRQ